MRTPALSSMLVAAAALLIGAGVATAAATRLDEPANGYEVARIQAHFDSILTDLPGRTAPSLTAEQRASRASLLATLRAYRDAGRFPQNRDFADPTPYFVDPETGVLCAVGHLLASTGRRDIVDRVAAADNHVRVAALAADTAFAAWLELHGLTLADAAWIQPMYGGPSPWPAEPVAPDRVSTLASAGTMVASTAFAFTNAAGNREGHSLARAVAGAAAGALSLGVAAAGIDGSSTARGLAVGNAVAGSASLYIAARATERRRDRDGARREPERPVRVSVAPILPLTRSAGAGVSVGVSF